MLSRRYNLLLVSALLTLTSSTPPITKASAQNSAVVLPPQLPVTGWLAFATKSKNNSRDFSWLPVNSQAQVAIFSQDWIKVKSGTPLVALAPGIKQQIKFRRFAEEAYGCDNGRIKMGTFTAPKAFPGGPVWLLPPGSANNATALRLEPLKLNQLPTNILPANRRKPSDARAWKVGATTIVMQKQSNLGVKLTFLMNSKVFSTIQAEKYFFEGAEKKPVNLSEESEPGIPIPVGAFQLKPNQPPVIVLWKPGYEGNNFEVLAQINGQVQRLEVASVYSCAF
jgi:hypothetical protein